MIKEKKGGGGPLDLHNDIYSSVFFLYTLLSKTLFFLSKVVTIAAI